MLVTRKNFNQCLKTPYSTYKQLNVKLSAADDEGDGQVWRCGLVADGQKQQLSMYERNFFNGVNARPNSSNQVN